MNVHVFTICLAVTLAMPLAAQANEKASKASSQSHEKAQAHRAQQHEENKAFRDSLKDVPEGQRQQAIMDHRKSQIEENLAAHAQRHEQRMAELRTKLAANTDLTNEQKQDILAKAQKEYQDNVTKAKTRQTESLNYAQQVFNDESLSPNQKKEKMKAHREELKEERKDLKQDRQSRREDLREEFKKKKNDMKTQMEKK